MPMRRMPRSHNRRTRLWRTRYRPTSSARSSLRKILWSGHPRLRRSRHSAAVRCRCSKRSWPAVDKRPLNDGQRDYSGPVAAAAALEALGPLVAPALPELRETIGTLNASISFLRGFTDDEYKDVEKVLSPLQSLLATLVALDPIADLVYTFETAKDVAKVRDAVSELGTSGEGISPAALQALLHAACVDGGRNKYWPEAVEALGKLGEHATPVKPELVVERDALRRKEPKSVSTSGKRLEALEEAIKRISGTWAPPVEPEDPTTSYFKKLYNDNEGDLDRIFAALDESPAAAKRKPPSDAADFAAKYAAGSYC